jgi:hypothetical protein
MALWHLCERMFAKFIKKLTCKSSTKTTGEANDFRWNSCVLSVPLVWILLKVEIVYGVLENLDGEW